MSTRTRETPAPPPRRTPSAARPAPAASRDQAMEAKVVRHRPARWLIALAVVAVLAVVAYGVTRSPFLAVDKIVVRGAHHTTPAQVEHAAGVARGDALFWLSTGDAASGLAALPWVRTAKVTKDWPHTVRITVSERTPVAWADAPAGKAVVDGTGRVLEVVDAPPPGLPKLVGLAAVPAPGGTIAPAAPARAAAALPGLAAVGTTSVTAGAGGNLTMQLAGGTELRLGDSTQLRAKVAAALAVVAAMAGQPVAYVDVSVPTNPVAG